MARSLTRARGITANVIMPGVVKTDIFNEVSDGGSMGQTAGTP